MANTGFNQPEKGKLDWQTPPELFDKLWEEFGPFTFDPCCLLAQHTAIRVRHVGGGTVCIPSEEMEEGYDREHIKADGLAQPWHGRVFMNPPYNKVNKKAGILTGLPDWVAKAVKEVECGNAELVCALLPARVESKWWQEYVLRELRCDWRGDRALEAQAEYNWLMEAVRFLPGRLHFVDATNAARFPSAVVVWRR